MKPNNCTPSTYPNNATTHAPAERKKIATIASILLVGILLATASDSPEEPAPLSSHIPQWQLLAFDDFNEPKENSDNQFSMIGDNQVLGGQGSTTQRLSLPLARANYQDLKIVFDYYFIDSWDNEFAALESQIQYADGSSGPKEEVWREAGHAHFFPNTIGGNIYRDYRSTVRVVVDKLDPGKRISGITLYFHAYLDSDSRDESWGVDNLEVFGR